MGSNMQRECSLVSDLMRESSGWVINLPAPSSDVAGGGDAHASPAIADRPAARVLLREKIKARRLVVGEEPQVIEFLNLQPLKNVQMVGLLRDHGLESPYSRGTFYGCFSGGCLVGVALIGHHVLLSGSQQAITIFARIARLVHKQEIYLVLGEEDVVRNFHGIMSQSLSHPNACQSQSQLLFVLTGVVGAVEEIKGLRLAEAQEADEVAQLHAAACLEQLGVDPSLDDPLGFRQRVRARIEMGRTWILRDRHQQIIFKTEIANKTDQIAYLEAVWTKPEVRSNGIGHQALRDLCQRLLKQHQVVSLFVDAEEHRRISFYRSIGFEMLAPYRVIRYYHSSSHRSSGRKISPLR